MDEPRTPAQQFYDKNGFYARQTDEPRHEGTYLAWSQDMTNRRRHCWDGKNPDKNDEPTRWLDNRSAEYIERQRQHRDDDWGADESWKICDIDHSDDPKVVGEIEWMRFIHEWGRIAPTGKRYFTDDGLLWITPTGLPMSNGQLCYAEAYFNVPPPEHHKDPGFSFRLKIVLFLNNAAGWARIECYDEKLVDLCEQVWGNVQASFEPVPA